LETLFEPNGDSSGKKIEWSNEMNELRNENKTTSTRQTNKLLNDVRYKTMKNR